MAKVKVYSPAVETILAMSDLPTVNTVGDPGPQQEIVAMATAVFSSITPKVYDSHKYLAAQLAIDYGNHAWFVPAQERMPFPDALIYAIASMMKSEKIAGRRADWFLWVEDDISIPQTFMQSMRAAADPIDKPFVAAVGHDRYPPFYPAVWDWDNEKKTLVRWREVPPKGLYRVGCTGLVAALFHRSLFDRVPQPWFTVSDREIMGDGEVQVTGGFKPDTWWSHRLRQLNIPIHVLCGVETTHHGMCLPVNTRTTSVLREMQFMANRDELERMTRGRVVET